jgi:hypothetical protein
MRLRQIDMQPACGFVRQVGQHNILADHKIHLTPAGHILNVAFRVKDLSHKFL